MFSFLIKRRAKNGKKQFRNAHSKVITARIIANEPAERRREAGEAAELSESRA